MKKRRLLTVTVFPVSMESCRISTSWHYRLGKDATFSYPHLDRHRHHQTAKDVLRPCHGWICVCVCWHHPRNYDILLRKKHKDWKKAGDIASSWEQYRQAAKNIRMPKYIQLQLQQASSIKTVAYRRKVNIIRNQFTTICSLPHDEETNDGYASEKGRKCEAAVEFVPLRRDWRSSIWVLYDLI